MQPEGLRVLVPEALFRGIEVFHVELALRLGLIHDLVPCHSGQEVRLLGNLEYREVQRGCGERLFFGVHFAGEIMRVAIAPGNRPRRNGDQLSGHP